MGRDLYDNCPAARAVYDQAEAAWPGLRALCFDGPADALNQTVNTQPCLFVTDLACAAAAVDAGLRPQGLAGFSLGEVAAACFADVMPFDQALNFVRRRAEAMAAGGQRQPGTMVAVLGLDQATVEAVAASAGAYPVNFNCPGQIGVACAVDQVDVLRQAVTAAGGKALPLAVSGAFHSPLMDQAAADLAVWAADLDFALPQLPLYANLTAQPYGDPYELLTAQVNHPVRWQDSVTAMVAAGFDHFVEVGPGTTLSGFIRKIDRNAQTMSINDSASLAATAQVFRV